MKLEVGIQTGGDHIDFHILIEYMVSIRHTFVRYHRRIQVNCPNLALLLIQSQFVGIDVENGRRFQYGRLIELVQWQDCFEKCQQIRFEHSVDWRLHAVDQVILQLHESLVTAVDFWKISSAIKPQFGIPVTQYSVLTRSDRFCWAEDIATAEWHNTPIPFYSRRRHCSRCCTGISSPPSERIRPCVSSISRMRRCTVATCISNISNSCERFAVSTCGLLAAPRYLAATANDCSPSKSVCWWFSDQRPMDVHVRWLHHILCHESLEQIDRSEHFRQSKKPETSWTMDIFQSGKWGIPIAVNGEDVSGRSGQ